MIEGPCGLFAISYRVPCIALPDVILQAVGTGADGQQTYRDAARTPQAMRHMTNKLGVEQVCAVL